MTKWLSCCLLLMLGEFSFQGKDPNGILASAVSTADPNEILKSTITRHKYPAELHPVISSDGYHLTMARIPQPGKPILFLMHAFLSSSSDFTVLGPKNSLAFEAFDSGFDVWLANGRGNAYSRSHSSLHPSEKQFWDFSFHEVSTLDIPAMIDYVLNNTGRSKIHYVGHSQGGTNFLAMASTLPEYNKKIGSAHLSSPVAFWSRNTTPMNYFYDEVIMLTQFLDQIQMYELGSRYGSNLMEYVQMAVDGGCVTEDMLMMVMGLIVGDHRETLNHTTLTSIMKEVPAGGSLKQGLHFLQMMKSKRFSQYDYGKQENLKRYGEVGPPDYALEKITAPVALYYGMNDPFVAMRDLDLLAGKLPKVVLKLKLADPKWNHVDFIYGSHGSTAHQVVLKLSKEYES